MEKLFIKCVNKGQVTVRLPSLGTKGRSLTFAPNEIKEVHPVDVKFKDFQNLIRAGILVDVTKIEKRRRLRQRARTIAMSKVESNNKKELPVVS